MMTMMLMTLFWRACRDLGLFVRAGTTSQSTRPGHPRWAASRARCQTQSQLLLWRQWIFLKSGKVVTSRDWGDDAEEIENSEDMEKFYKPSWGAPRAGDKGPSQKMRALVFLKSMASSQRNWILLWCGMPQEIENRTDGASGVLWDRWTTAGF